MSNFIFIIFKHKLCSEEYIMDDSSDEDEEDYEDFNKGEENKLSSNENLIDMLSQNSKSCRKFSIEGLFEKKNKNSTNVKNLLNKNKMGKLAKMSNKNRLIRSMQNLLFFDRSRSNSMEKGSTENELELKGKPKTSATDNNSPKTSDSANKTDLFKSLFVSFI